MKDPAGYSWIYFLGGVIVFFSGYADWKPGGKRSALAYILVGLALMLVGAYWWMYGGRF